MKLKKLVRNLMFVRIVADVLNVVDLIGHIGLGMVHIGANGEEFINGCS